MPSLTFRGRGRRGTERQPSEMLVWRACLPQDRMGEKRKMASSRHRAAKLAKLQVRPCLQLLTRARMPARQGAPRTPRHSLRVPALPSSPRPSQYTVVFVQYQLTELLNNTRTSALVWRGGDTNGALEGKLENTASEKHEDFRAKHVFRPLVALWKRKRFRYADASEKSNFRNERGEGGKIC